MQVSNMNIKAVGVSNLVLAAATAQDTAAAPAGTGQCWIRADCAIWYALKPAGAGTTATVGGATCILLPPNVLEVPFDCTAGDKLSIISAAGGNVSVVWGQDS